MAAISVKSAARAIAVASGPGFRRSISTARVSLMPPKSDQVTHTGQSWDDDDHRSLRFMDKTKETNTKWAIDLIAAVPPIMVDKRVVACEGHHPDHPKNPALGHPKVYINLDSHEPVACIYCGLRYQFKAHE